MIRTWALVCVVLTLVVGAAAPALAAGAGSLQGERAEVARGLEAQFGAALIRERKLADDREQRLLDEAEARLIKARTDALAAKGDAHAARKELDAARADYAKLAQALAAKDAEARTQIDAYRTEVEGVAADASPEKLAALQQFADGDRTGAWPILEALRQAKKNAIQAVANAKMAPDAREAAGERLVMRDHGEATTADVLALYDEAAKLDPSNFEVQIQRAELAAEFGDVNRARAAAELAVATARTDPDRAVADVEVGNLEAKQGDYRGALTSLQAGLDISRRLAEADPKALAPQRTSLATLKSIGDLSSSSRTTSPAPCRFISRASTSRAGRRRRTPAPARRNRISWPCCSGSPTPRSRKATSPAR